VRFWLFDAECYLQCLGVAGKTGKKALAQVLGEAEAEGLGGEEIDKLEGQWMGSVDLCTFDQGITPSFSFNLIFC
jgi:hypothetical protein